MGKKRVQWNEVTALYGGTFDPPHLGHRIAVAGLFSEPGVARVIVIPSPAPPHKPTVASTEARLAMTELAFGQSVEFPLSGSVKVDLCELERAERNPERRTYTFDTLLELRREIPHLAFVIGTDQLLKLDTWHRFPELLSLSHWIVLERKSTSHSTRTEGEFSRVLTQWESSGLLKQDGSCWRIRPSNLSSVSAAAEGGTILQVFKTPAPELSSTKIRENLVKTGQPPEESLLPAVKAYLMQRGIYGTRS